MSKPTRTGAAAAVEDNMSIDDAASVCSNVSDGTSNYDDVEGKEIERNYLD
jgi:hypothetical protein